MADFSSLKIRHVSDWYRSNHNWTFRVRFPGDADRNQYSSFSRSVTVWFGVDVVIETVNDVRFTLHYSDDTPIAVRDGIDWSSIGNQRRAIYRVNQCLHLVDIALTCLRRDSGGGIEFYQTEKCMIGLALGELFGAALGGVKEPQKVGPRAVALAHSQAWLPSEPAWLADKTEDQLKESARMAGYSGKLFWCDVVRGLSGDQKSA